MRAYCFGAAALFFAITSPLAAQAKSAFYVQLGTAATEQEAEEKWESLRKSYSALLSGLEFSPRTVAAVGSEGTEVRVQAGPARSRDNAQRICATLTSKDVECYIVETAVFAGEPSIPRRALATNLTPPKPAPEPAAAEAPAETPPPAGEKIIVTSSTSDVPAKKSSGGILNYLFGDDDDEKPKAAESQVADAAPVPTPAPATREEKPAAPEPEPVTAASEPAPAPASPPPGSLTIPPRETTEAAPAPATEPVALPWANTSITTAKRVDVAEAIPVPLSADKPAEPIAPAPITISPGEQPVNASTAASIPAEVRWLQISGFANEQEAYLFSQSLHTELQDRGSLRMRVNRPLFARTSQRAVTLTVGPVVESAVVERICVLATQQANPLKCGGSADQSEVASNLFTRKEERAALAPAAAPVPTENLYSGNPPEAFFVQLGSWRNQNEALRRWDTLKEQHPELLRNREPDVKAPPRISINARASVRLRTGPFTSRSEAENLCSRLAAKGASCIIVME